MPSRNRSLCVEESEITGCINALTLLSHNTKEQEIVDRIVNQDMLEACAYLPSNFVDLLVLDPPYNLDKSFNGTAFRKRSLEDYTDILDTWLSALTHTLKETATVYICGDWRSSHSIFSVASKYFTVRNRITWEREKGRSASTNWKNCTEDIWFCTLSDRYTFNADAVRLKRKVIAPYRNGNGTARDWFTEDSGNFRMTGASNVWTDITVPFWSMPENTDHPSQKPEPKQRTAANVFRDLVA